MEEVQFDGFMPIRIYGELRTALESSIQANGPASTEPKEDRNLNIYQHLVNLIINAHKVKPLWGVLDNGENRDNNFIRAVSSDSKHRVNVYKAPANQFLPGGQSLGHGLYGQYTFHSAQTSPGEKRNHGSSSKRSRAMEATHCEASQT